MIVMKVLIFITFIPGGGVIEGDKAADLSKKLNCKIEPYQVVMSHTPFKRLLPKYGNSRILVIGGDACMDVARYYGFHKAVSSFDLHKVDSGIYPLIRGPLSSTTFPPEQSLLLADISAAFVFGESTHWGLDIQVLSDLLMTHSRSCAKESNQFPIFACNADLVYSTTQPLPRYTQGAFVHAFSSLHQLYTNSSKPVEIDFCGKPFAVQYRVAEEMLKETARRMWTECDDEVFSMTRFYGVGDNPKSDIRGANGAGKSWRSVLVRTGVFTGDGNDAEDKADFVEDDILGAVHRILQTERDNQSCDDLS